MVSINNGRVTLLRPGAPPLLDQFAERHSSMFSSTSKLESLLMDTGTVTKFVDEKTWTTLPGDLRKIFPTSPNNPMNEATKPAYTPDLCRVYRHKTAPR